MSKVPIAPECPIQCLGLSARAHTHLTRDNDPHREAPKTVADVLTLAQNRELIKIKGLGTKLVNEIEESLKKAGFEIGHEH